MSVEKDLDPRYTPEARRERRNFAFVLIGVAILVGLIYGTVMAWKL